MEMHSTLEIDETGTDRLYEAVFVLEALLYSSALALSLWLLYL